MEDIERLGRLTLQSPCKQVLSAKQQRSANNSASNGASVSSKSVSLKLDSTKQPNTALKQDKQGKQQTTPKTPNRFTPKKLNTSVTSTGSRLFDKEDKENSKQTPMKQIDLRLRKERVASSSKSSSSQSSTPAATVKKSTTLFASPRTPHVSQVNTKRQKQQSQLSRPQLSQLVTNAKQTAKSSETVEFAMPPPKQRTQVGDSGKLKPGDKVKELQKRLSKEIEEKQLLKRQLEEEREKRLAVEIECQILREKCKQLSN